MKIAFISDTHGFEGQLNVPKCDVLVHCGDVCASFGELSSIENIAYWFEQLKKSDTVQEVILVAGNHDTNFSSKPEMSKALLKNSCHFLQNDEVVINGIKFYGTTFLDILRVSNNISQETDDRVKFYNTIPKDTDVLITHHPPDILPLSGTIDGFNFGCPILKSVVEQIAPKVHAFGHSHEGGGMFYDGTTTYINAAMRRDRFIYTIDLIQNE